MTTGIVYILAPANFATGGPELLHQLGSRLRAAGLDARMYYYPSEHPNPVHPNYLEYHLPREQLLVDAPENWLIVPEIFTAELFRYQHLRKAVWWLSVDNYFWHLPGWRYLNYAQFRWLGKQAYWGFDRRLSQINLHLVQSTYAKNMLAQKGISNPIFLSDFLHNQFLQIKTDQAIKEPMVAYNPKKGKQFTKALIASMPDVRFLKLEGMSRVEMVQALQRCQLYIDFGQHPGKDRIPREAAVLGCCVLVNQKGAAAFEADLPFDAAYKLPENKKLVAKRIREILANYEAHLPHFEKYVHDIMQQEQCFEQELAALIKKL
jgi:hypothetical protein